MTFRRPTFLAAAVALATGLSACTATGHPDRGATPFSPPAVPVSPSAGGLTATESSAGDPFAPGDGNSGYDVQHYGLKLTIDPGNRSRQLDGTATITAKAAGDLTRFNLDLTGLTVASVTVAGTAARYLRQGSELVVTPAKPITKNAAFTTVVTYSGTPQPVQDPTLGRYGWIGAPQDIFVAGQPSGAHTWFPCDDHPSDKATFDYEITTPAGLTVIANGEPVGGAPLGSATPPGPGRSASPNGPAGDDGDSPPITNVGYRANTTVHWRVADPMATYLATVDVGRFQVRQGRTPGGIPMITAVSNPAINVDELSRTVADITDAWTGLFGRYPFTSTGAIAAATDVNFALETQDRPIFGTFGANVPSVVAHELAHQWFGDSVSVTKWQDIWLNEGFATYAEWTWGERTGGVTVQQHFDDRYRSADRWDIATADPGSRVTMFDEFGVYARGAMTLHVLRKRVGDEKFWKILRTWAAEHRHASGTTAEFIATAQRVSGEDLGRLFQVWLYGKTRPTSW